MGLYIYKPPVLPTRKPEQVSWISLTHKGTDTRTIAYIYMQCNITHPQKEYNWTFMKTWMDL